MLGDVALPLTSSLKASASPMLGPFSLSYPLHVRSRHNRRGGGAFEDQLPDQPIDGPLREADAAGAEDDLVQTREDVFLKLSFPDRDSCWRTSGLRKIRSDMMNVLPIMTVRPWSPAEDTYGAGEVSATTAAKFASLSQWVAIIRIAGAVIPQCLETSPSPPWLLYSSSASRCQAPPWYTVGGFLPKRLSSL